MLKDTLVSPTLSRSGHVVVPGQCGSTVLSTEIVVSLEIFIFGCTGDDDSAECRSSEDEGGEEGAHCIEEEVVRSRKPHEQYL